MKKVLKAAVAVIIALAITAIMIVTANAETRYIVVTANAETRYIVVTANAETRYIEKTFVFGRYAPNVHFINAALGTALEVKADGSVCWKKLRENNDYNDVSQCFTILPAGSGYYTIAEVVPMGGHNPRVLTYKPGKGFFMDWPSGSADTQKFRFKWYSSTTCGGRTIKNCWRLVCKKDSIAFCTGGWSTLRIRQDNWSADY